MHRRRSRISRPRPRHRVAAERFYRPGYTLIIHFV